MSSSSNSNHESPKTLLQMDRLKTQLMEAKRELLLIQTQNEVLKKERLKIEHDYNLMEIQLQQAL